jgi:hypothetical protein
MHGPHDHHARTYKTDHLASGASSATRARWPRSGRTDGRAAHGWIRPSGRTPGCADGSSSWKATWLARAR